MQTKRPKPAPQTPADITSVSDLTSYAIIKEGLKHQMTVGDGREFIRIIADAMFANPQIIELMLAAARKRAK